MESASLCVWKRVRALNGTGVGTVVEAAAVPPPAGLGEVDRVVPFNDVFALEETLPVAPALVRTFVVEVAVEDDDSAEVAVTGAKADVVLLLLETSVDTADVEAAGSDEFAPVDGVSSAFPDDGAAPVPAPEDEPAVFDAAAVDEVPVDEDWI